MNLTEEEKQSKIMELSNLISQYDSGVRETLNKDSYSLWVKIVAMLKQAEISAELYEDFILNPTHYLIQNGEIILNENWEQEEIQAEQERIAKLRITKRDFYLYVLKPFEISYAQLLQIIGTDEELQAAWDLCAYVYRGDEYLNSFLFGHIPDLTEDYLTQVFEEHNVA
jgi:hypothetical protein